MPLMDRIKVVDFLSLSEPMQINFIDSIRKKRSAAITFALAQKKKKIPKKKPVRRIKSIGEREYYLSGGGRGRPQPWEAHLRRN